LAIYSGVAVDVGSGGVFDCHWRRPGVSL